MVVLQSHHGTQRLAPGGFYSMIQLLSPWSRIWISVPLSSLHRCRHGQRPTLKPSPLPSWSASHSRRMWPRQLTNALSVRGCRVSRDPKPVSRNHTNLSRKASGSTWHRQWGRLRCVGLAIMGEIRTQWRRWGRRRRRWWSRRGVNGSGQPKLLELEP